jgi:hypothetical protein
MKSIKVIGTTALVLFFGIAAPANARQEKPREESKPAKQEQPAKPEKQQQAKAPQQAKPEKQQQAQAPKQNDSAKQQHANAPKQQQDKSASQTQHAKGQQPQQGNSSKQQQQAKAPQQQPHQQQARSSQAPQRTQNAIARQRAQPALRLSARGSGRIPDDRFRSNFGRDHNFRMGNPVIVSGYSRFQYGGFWFGFVEPWPTGWYYTDDVYIDYVDGGYYMYDPYYPGARFAISVVI